MKTFKKKVGFKKFIFEQPKQLTPQFCDNLIYLYETDPQAVELRTAGRSIGSENVLDLKQSEDVNISKLDVFKHQDKVLCIALKKLMRNYVNYLSENFNYAYDNLRVLNYEDSGFQMQKTTPNGFYDWHNDGFDTRYFTYIFYLNDIHNKGETEFANGLKVKPEQGKALMFPASWEYVHRGIAPKNEIKYIATGWVSAIYESHSHPDNIEPTNLLT